MSGTSPAKLWKQAHGDREEYHRLLREHGHILAPGDPGYEDAPQPASREPRCDITDLLVSQCGHCHDFHDDLPSDSENYGPWFPARFGGTCDGCGEHRFEAGDRIRSDGEGGWLAECCGEDGGR